MNETQICSRTNTNATNSVLFEIYRNCAKKTKGVDVYKNKLFASLSEIFV